MRKIVALTLLAVAVVTGCKGWPETAEPVVKPEKTVSWEEDELPAYLTDWVDREGADLQRKAKFIDANDMPHRNCWMAIADTTRVACPDGYRGES